MNKTLVGGLLVALAMPCSAQANDSWDFRLSPYIWFAGVDGDVATIPGLPDVPIDISPSDAFDDNEASYMLILTGQKGRHGFLMDFLYTDTQSDEDLVKQIDLKLKSISQNTLFSLAYYYEIYNRNGANLDTFIGARYWDVDTTLKFSGGLGQLAGQRIESQEDWIDPFVGMKGRTPLGDSRFYLTGWAGLGGFGVSSEMFYDASINLGYQWSDAIGTTVGYRIFDVDYDNSGFVYDVEQYGFILGLTWSF
ncbi:hypothetical protein [Haliea sp. E17]|uniref:hypothetical protein n=1 Tax=Haliea sp. E17 TaxID=3401576 RepID=UPI003AB0A29B